MKKLLILVTLILSANAFADLCDLKAWPRNDLGKFAIFPTKVTHEVSHVIECIDLAKEMVQKEWTQLECDKDLDCFDLNYFYKNVYYKYDGVNSTQKGKVKR